MGLISVIVSFFIMMNQKTYILLRIEFLVVLVTVLFLATVILDNFRRICRSTFVKVMLSLLDAASDSIVVYLLGAMQTAPFRNQLFPVWALVLVNFRYSIDFISGYDLPDRTRRSFTEVTNIIKLLGVAFLNWSRGSKFALPLWSLWGLQVLRSFYIAWARIRALGSSWHSGSSDLLPEYMRTYRKDCRFDLTSLVPSTMQGYKYLVYGESKRKIVIQKPRYTLTLAGMPERPLATTLDRIWSCNAPLLQHPVNGQGNSLKDLCLAFALSRLLRCRLEDAELHEDTVSITQKLVQWKVCEDDATATGRVFGVLEMELAFLSDYLHTRFPMIFWEGLCSLCLSLLQSAASITVICWLAVEIRSVYIPPRGELAHLVRGVNVDMAITWMFMLFMVFKEIWEMVTYLLSDWTRLLLVCKYVDRGNCCCMSNAITGCLIRCFCKSRIVDEQWHGFIDQYVFVQSFDYSAWIWKCANTLTTGMVPNKEDGANAGDAVRLPEGVKPEIQRTLRLLDLTGDHLPKNNGIPSLRGGDLMQQFGWTFTHPRTCSHVIMVWHIATSLCEMKFAQDHNVNLGDPGFLCSALSCLTNFCRCCCCSRDPYLVSESILGNVPSDLKTRYTVANSLSRYCAYLLISKPDLLPDSFLVPNTTFRETVRHARETLKDCASLQSRYDKLNDIKDGGDIKLNGNIVQQGAILGQELIKRGDCWKILAEVWADLLVHIAPTWNAQAHKKCLESGGEFITHIWALLWHCGIYKSKLWAGDEESANNAPGAPLGNNVVAAAAPSVQPPVAQQPPITLAPATDPLVRPQIDSSQDDASQAGAPDPEGGDDVNNVADITSPAAVQPPITSAPATDPLVHQSDTPTPAIDPLVLPQINSSPNNAGQASSPEPEDRNDTDNVANITAPSS